MKINTIRFENLNSLVGRWEIDFTANDYREQSIFAITGPTGAGKSTILDAICLALYGRTPRLEKISKSTNEIMSRHCGSCFAEVEFETFHGTFRCHWSQHRSRKKSSGELQQPKHEIADAVTGEILHNKIRDVLQMIIDVTGMDFDRFTRSTLLAQGAFAAFLQAKGDERAPLLEQISGSKIYSQLSMQVHAITSQAKTDVTALKEALSHIEIFSTEEEASLLTHLKEAEKQKNSALHQVELLLQQQTWLKSLETLQKEIDDHKKGVDALIKEHSRHLDTLQALPLSLAAQELSPLYQESERLQKTVTANIHTKEVLQKKHNTLTVTLEQLLPAIQASTKELNTIREKEQQETQLIQEVEKLDGTIRTENSVLTHIEKEVAQLSAELENVEQTLVDLQTTQQTIQKGLAETTAYFQQHQDNEQLITEYITIETKIASLLDLRKKEKKLREQQEAATPPPPSLQTINQQSSTLKKDLDFLESRLQLLIRIHGLEEERKHLLAGEPCPLCGATEHPYEAKRHISIPGEDRLSHLLTVQEMLHALSTSWKQKKKQEEQLQRDSLLNKTQLETARHQQQTLRIKKRQKESEQQQIQERLTHLQAKRFKLYGAKDPARESALLKAERNKIQQKVERQEQEYQHKDKEHVGITSRLLQLEEQQKSLEQELEKSKIRFSSALNSSPFLTQQDFSRALLPPAEIKALQKRQDIYREEHAGLQRLIQDKTERLISTQEQKLTTDTLVSIEPKLLDAKSKAEAFKETIISIQERLKQNDNAKEKHHKQVQAIHDKRKQLYRWNRLHALIGSADGKKFRNFAQGLTFEMMVAYANRDLARMNNRYILVRDLEQPLSLNVIDTYQGGEVRSTINLSGGESFLISLALALGLSRMSSNTIRVDSLFLDEGFGSLDEETLESALDTLATLQEENKLIGVISHVAAVQQRIPLQIHISAQANGKSTIKGAGVARI